MRLRLLGVNKCPVIRQIAERHRPHGRPVERVFAVECDCPSPWSHVGELGRTVYYRWALTPVLDVDMHPPDGISEEQWNRDALAVAHGIYLWVAKTGVWGIHVEQSRRGFHVHANLKPGEPHPPAAVRALGQAMARSLEKFLREYEETKDISYWHIDVFPRGVDEGRQLGWLGVWDTPEIACCGPEPIGWEELWAFFQSEMGPNSNDPTRSGRDFRFAQRFFRSQPWNRDKNHKDYWWALYERHTLGKVVDDVVGSPEVVLDGSGPEPRSVCTFLGAPVYEGELVVLSGAPGIGKSTLAFQELPDGALILSSEYSAPVAQQMVRYWANGKKYLFREVYDLEGVRAALVYHVERMRAGESRTPVVCIDTLQTLIADYDEGNRFVEWLAGFARATGVCVIVISHENTKQIEDIHRIEGLLRLRQLCSKHFRMVQRKEIRLVKDRMGFLSNAPPVPLSVPEAAVQSFQHETPETLPTPSGVDNNKPLPASPDGDYGAPAMGAPAPSSHWAQDGNGCWHEVGETIPTPEGVDRGAGERSPPGEINGGANIHNFTSERTAMSEDRVTARPPIDGFVASANAGVYRIVDAWAGDGQYGPYVGLRIESALGGGSGQETHFLNVSANQALYGFLAGVVSENEEFVPLREAVGRAVGKEYLIRFRFRGGKRRIDMMVPRTRRWERLLYWEPKREVREARQTAGSENPPPGGDDV